MIYTCQVPFVQTMDSVIHCIDHYPADRYLGNQLYLIQWIDIYPVDSVRHLLKWKGGGRKKYITVFARLKEGTLQLQLHKKGM